jgi:quinol-cytochrome oxidoreductase complex cytochrome b subunit
VNAPPRFVLDRDDDARRAPVRLVVIQDERRPAVDETGEPVVMTMPHLLVRELIALLAFSLALALLAIFVDAPLEEIANPLKTPNPAKAPWYFLGLQELLHYYPPFISGVLLPAAVILALVVIPYFNVNLERRPLAEARHGRALAALGASVAAISAVLLTTASHPLWPVLAPLWLVAACMALPEIWPRTTGVAGWLGRRSLAFWIFTWFLLATTALTVIGVLFRGPGWAFTLPWRDGIY